MQTHIRVVECYVGTKILLTDYCNTHDLILCDEIRVLLRGYFAFFGGVLKAPAALSAATFVSS